MLPRHPVSLAGLALVLGFLVEVIQKIGAPELEERLIAAVEQELAEGRSVIAASADEAGATA